MNELITHAVDTPMLLPVVSQVPFQTLEFQIWSGHGA